MSNNINSDTDFSDLTISNDYPCLIGETWTAELVDGKTVYTNGTETYTGPVNLIGATLNISSGAVVDGLVTVSNATYSIINVNDGGTLENSDIINGYTNVNSGGVSQSNNYISEAFTISAGGSSIDDTFYNPAATSSTSGTLVSSNPTTGQSTNFVVSDANGPILVSGNNTSFINPTISSKDVSSSNAGYYTVALGNNSQFGNAAVGATHDSSQYATTGNFTLSNDYISYEGGSWTAELVDGQTVYVGTGVTAGPGVVNGSVTVAATNVNFVNATTFTVLAGATVNGITMTGSNYPRIDNYGTIENSFISNGYLYNWNGALSQNNTYISEEFYNELGSTSKNDYLYENGAYVYGKYNLTNCTFTLPTFMLSDNDSVVQIYAGSTFDGSYVATGPNGTMYVYPYINEDVISCFLASSMINTSGGLIAVEDIKVGDSVICYNGEEQENRAVIWTGYNTAVVNKTLPGCRQ